MEATVYDAVTKVATALNIANTRDVIFLGSYANGFVVGIRNADGSVTNFTVEVKKESH